MVALCIFQPDLDTPVWISSLHNMIIRCWCNFTEVQCHLVNQISQKFYPTSEVGCQHEGNGLKLNKHPNPRLQIVPVNLSGNQNWNDLEPIRGNEKKCPSGRNGRGIALRYICNGQSANVIEMITVRSIVWWRAQSGIYQSDGWLVPT